MREHLPDESVDLVYLDPPFNSNASYNVLFREKSGEDSPAQIKAFTDTWEWTLETERTFEQDIIHSDLWQQDFPKIQLRTIEELLSGRGFDLPPRQSGYQPAERVRRPQGTQARLGE